MQEHWYEHFYNDDRNGLLEDVALFLINNTDGKDYKNSKKSKTYWMSMFILRRFIIYLLRFLSYFADNTLRHENNYDCMWLGLRFSENDFIFFTLFSYYVYVYFSITYVFVNLYCLRHMIILYRCFKSLFIIVYEIRHWTNNEIGVAVRSWFWVRVELMAW